MSLVLTVSEHKGMQSKDARKLSGIVGAVCQCRPINVEKVLSTFLPETMMSLSAAIHHSAASYHLMPLVFD